LRCQALQSKHACVAVSPSSGPLPLRGLRWLLATGEALPARLGREWLAGQWGGGLINAYGPTECSDDVTQHDVPRTLAAEAGAMPIGRPLRDTQLYVDTRGLAGAGGRGGGAVCGGQAVGRGYAGAAGKMAEGFVPDPFGPPGSRLYRTGDRGR